MPIFLRRQNDTSMEFFCLSREQLDIECDRSYEDKRVCIPILREVRLPPDRIKFISRDPHLPDRISTNQPRLSSPF